MTTLEIGSAILGVAIITLVLWKFKRHGAVPPTLDVDPDDHQSWFR